MSYQYPMFPEEDIANNFSEFKINFDYIHNTLKQYEKDLLSLKEELQNKCKELDFVSS